jgi:hypothetical protein
MISYERFFVVVLAFFGCLVMIMGCAFSAILLVSGKVDPLSAVPIFFAISSVCVVYGVFLIWTGLKIWKVE